jgi:hypothetical protein
MNEEVDNLVMFAALAGYQFAKANSADSQRNILGEGGGSGEMLLNQ